MINRFSHLVISVVCLLLIIEDCIEPWVQCMYYRNFISSVRQYITSDIVLTPYITTWVVRQMILLFVVEHCDVFFVAVDNFHVVVLERLLSFSLVLSRWFVIFERLNFCRGFSSNLETLLWFFLSKQ